MVVLHSGYKDYTVLIIVFTYGTVPYEDSSLMHTCFKDYIVHQCRNYVRYVGTDVRYGTPSYSIQQQVVRYCTVLYCTVQCKNFLYGPIDAMISSQGDDPMALYFIYAIIICYSFAE